MFFRKKPKPPKNIELIKVIDSIYPKPTYVFDDTAKPGEFTLRLASLIRQNYPSCDTLYLMEFAGCILHGLDVKSMGESILEYFKCYHCLPWGCRKIGLAISRRDPYNPSSIVVLAY
jgi:hypothetical protein